MRSDILGTAMVLISPPAVRQRKQALVDIFDDGALRDANRYPLSPSTLVMPLCAEARMKKCPAPAWQYRA